MVGGAIPVVHKCQQFLIVYFFYGGIFQDSKFKLKGRVVLNYAGGIGGMAGVIAGHGGGDGAPGVVALCVGPDSNIVDKLNRITRGGGMGIGNLS